jgi:hypothetical protein
MPVKVEPISGKELDLRLGALEEHYHMPSERFIEAFRNGVLHESPDFHEWASLIAARELARGERAPR